MQPLWKTVWRFLRKLKIEPSYDPAIPLLGIYLKKTKTLIQEVICTPIFTQTYRGLLLSHKKEWNLAICNSMDGSRGYYAKWNKSDKERKILYDFIYMWNISIKICFYFYLFIYFFLESLFIDYSLHVCFSKWWYSRSRNPLLT